jgi:quercetin dioxygenase-like cupin family protein
VRLAVYAAAFALAACTSAAEPAPAQATRTILSRADAQPGQETVLGQLDAPAGAPVARHIHFGVEQGVVITGVIEFTIEGEPTRILRPGDHFAVPREKPHGGRILEGPARIVSAWTVDKGKPLAEPAPASP